MDIRGAAAIVTGGGSGLGAATARMLGAAGGKVAVLDVNDKAAAEVVIDVNGIAIWCDVTDSAAAEKALAKARPITGLRASSSIAPVSARPNASSAAMDRCRLPNLRASSRST